MPSRQLFKKAGDAVKYALHYDEECTVAKLEIIEISVKQFVQSIEEHKLIKHAALNT